MTLVFFRPKIQPPGPNANEPVKEVPPPSFKEPKKEPTKNVSFKNHLDYTSPPPSNKAVPEKDQLAKLPYGWNAEVLLSNRYVLKTNNKFVNPPNNT